MTPEDRAALDAIRQRVADGYPINRRCARALLSALAEAEARLAGTHGWVYCPHCGSCGVGGCCGFFCATCKDRHDGETQDGAAPRDLGDLRESNAARVTESAVRADRAESETAALRAEVERLRQSMTVPEHVTSLVASERDALRAEVETLTREARDLRSRSAADAEWMAQAVESIEGLTVTTPDFTGHPVVDVVRSLRAEVKRMREAARWFLPALEEQYEKLGPARDSAEGREYATRLLTLRAALSGGEHSNAR